MRKQNDHTASATQTRSNRLWLASIGATIVLTVGIGSWWGASSGTPKSTLNKTNEPAIAAEPWFVECAVDSGISFRHTRGEKPQHWFPEIVTGGCGLFDYDNDGDLDAYLVQGGEMDDGVVDKPASALFRNRGDGTFEEITEVAGVGQKRYGMGCATGDYDNDGDIDLFVTNLGGNTLYQNQGDGTFKEVTDQAGVRGAKWSASAAFADYDADGWLDLFVVNYVSWTPQTELHCRDGAGRRDYCKPSNYNAPAIDTLYHNRGDGTFEDVTELAGLAAAFGNGLGICHGDFNQDGRLDFYVANDGMPNQLWINKGDGRFENDALVSGCAVNAKGTAEAGMGVQAADVDQDGDLDFFISHLRGETNTLFVNHQGMFEDVTPITGLGAPSLPYTGWGTGFHDFDHDGQHDLFIANGSVARADKVWDPNDDYAEPNSLFRGLGANKFDEVLPQGGTGKIVLGSSRAAAFGDIDNDGDVDILIAEADGPAHLLRNAIGSRKSWIGLRLIERHGRDAIAATAKINAENKSFFRQVESAYSFAAANDSRIQVGLGGAEVVESVDVTWPDGSRESFGPFAARKYHTIRQGQMSSPNIGITLNQENPKALAP
ncbi:MAG: CRTAC1 family protein [Planctomycetes bacterium]|nr:CRTAC1 family protein [Planctomycetota bacterium]